MSSIISFLIDYSLFIILNIITNSTMHFNGNVVNNPTTMGKTVKERSVSDIVYIGY